MIPVEEGDLIRLIYKRQAGNYRWSEFICTTIYIGATKHGTMLTSNRPKAGTMEVRIADILFLEILAKHDTRSGRGDDRVELPERTGPYDPARWKDRQSPTHTSPNRAKASRLRRRGRR